MDRFHDPCREDMFAFKFNPTQAMSRVIGHPGPEGRSRLFNHKVS
jgi:hypothetical protein